MLQRQCDPLFTLKLIENPMHFWIKFNPIKWIILGIFLWLLGNLNIIQLYLAFDEKETQKKKFLHELFLVLELYLNWVYEVFHTFFVVTGQLVAYFAMIFWLFLFLFTFFVIFDYMNISLILFFFLETYLWNYKVG